MASIADIQQHLADLEAQAAQNATDLPGYHAAQQQQAADVVSAVSAAQSAQTTVQQVVDLVDQLVLDVQVLSEQVNEVLKQNPLP